MGLFTRFKRPKITYIHPAVEPKDYLKVTRINEETNTLHTALGMSDERASELSQKTKRAFIADSDIMNCMAVISIDCKHANELYFVSVVLTGLQLQQRHPIMGMMMGHGHDPDDN